MKRNISTKSLMCFILLIPFIEPLLFKEYPYLVIDDIYTILKLVALAVIILCTVSQRKYSKGLIIIILFELIIAFSTILHGGDIVKYCGPAVSVIGLTLITNYYLPKLKLSFFKILYVILFILIFINFITVMIFPNGIMLNSAWSKVYFLGIENRFVFFMLPLLFFSAIYSTKKYNKLNFIFFITVIMNLFTLIKVWSVGAMLGMSLISVMIIIFSKHPKIAKLDFKVYFWIIVILNILLVFMNIQYQFSDFIIDTLHKDITLSGRTYLWENAITLFKENPVLGIGVQSNDYLSIVYYGVTHPHNLFLNILVEVGILGASIYLILIFLLNRNTSKILDYRIKFIINISVFTLLFLSLVDTIDIGLVYVMYMVGILYNEVMESEENRTINPS